MKNKRLYVPTDSEEIALVTKRCSLCRPDVYPEVVVEVLTNWGSTITICPHHVGLLLAAFKQDSKVKLEVAR